MRKHSLTSWRPSGLFAPKIVRTISRSQSRATSPMVGCPATLVSRNWLQIGQATSATSATSGSNGGLTIRLSPWTIHSS